MSEEGLFIRTEEGELLKVTSITVTRYLHAEAGGRDWTLTPEGGVGEGKDGHDPQEACQP